MPDFDLILICLVAFGAAILTFFSGFGLGTLLTPVFALFFPIELAVALTGIVHFGNNLFKLFLMGRKAVTDVLIRFGVPAVLFAFLGARLLVHMAGLDPWFSYSFKGQLFVITPVKVVIAILLIIFSMSDFIPARKMKITSRMLPVGGVLSGFFGGLSGHQGALRAAFLIRTGLSKEGFIGTGVVISCFIDMARLSVYMQRYHSSDLSVHTSLVIAALISAMAGALIGRRLLTKVTLRFLQVTIAILVVFIALLLGSGLI